MTKYTNFILTIIAFGLIGLNIHFFKSEIISVANAFESHSHSSWDIFGVAEEGHSHSSWDIFGVADEDHDHDYSFSAYDYSFSSAVESIVEDCEVDSWGDIDC